MAASSETCEGDMLSVSSSLLFEKQQIVKELSDSYAEFTKVDISKERKLVEEATDELLTKLEEFMSLVDLVRTDNAICLTNTLPRIQDKYTDLQRVFQSIDRLEAFINLVRQNVDNLEVQITEAEKALLPENSLSKFFKPLFAKKDNTHNRPERQLEPYQPPQIFRTDQYITRVVNEQSTVSQETLNQSKQT